MNMSLIEAFPQGAGFLTQSLQSRKHCKGIKQLASLNEHLLPAEQMAVTAWGDPPWQGLCPVPRPSPAQEPTSTRMAWEAALPQRLCWFILAERTVSGDAAGCISCRKMKRMSQSPALP